MNDLIYFNGWNKRIKLRRNNQRLICIIQDQDGYITRLKCNINEKTMSIKGRRKEEIEFARVYESFIIRDATVDLNEDGEKWEGDLLNGLPFGYGCVYNAMNELVYSGFMFEGMKMCFGTEYHNSVLTYSGTFYKNQRHGYGTLYNLRGEVMYEGNWCFGKNCNVDNVVLTEDMSDESVHSMVEKLVIGNNYSYVMKQFRIDNYPALEFFIVGDNCFKGVDCFEMSNCIKLREITIGNNSFSLGKFTKSERRVLIHDCTSLKEITIGELSFQDYCEVFELRSIC